MSDEPRPKSHDHVITYGLTTIPKMEDEGWELAGAWTTRRPDEPQPYFVWKRAVDP